MTPAPRPRHWRCASLRSRPDLARSRSDLAPISQELAELNPPLHDVSPPVRVLFLIPSQPPPQLRGTPNGSRTLPHPRRRALASLFPRSCLLLLLTRRPLLVLATGCAAQSLSSGASSSAPLSPPASPKTPPRGPTPRRRSPTPSPRPRRRAAARCCASSCRRARHDLAAISPRAPTHLPPDLRRSSPSPRGAGARAAARLAERGARSRPISRRAPPPPHTRPRQPPRP